MKLTLVRLIYWSAADAQVSNQVKTTNVNVHVGRLGKQGFRAWVSTTAGYRGGLQSVDNKVGCVDEAFHTVGDARLGSGVQLVARTAHARIPASFCQSVHQLLKALLLRLHLHKPLHVGILKCLFRHPACGCHETKVVSQWRWCRGGCCVGTFGYRFDRLLLFQLLKHGWSSSNLPYPLFIY